MRYEPKTKSGAKYDSVAIKPHRMFDDSIYGWTIFAIKTNKEKDSMISLGTEFGEDLANEIADLVAQRLTGKDKAERLMGS
jgi:hypothetical protein